MAPRLKQLVSNMTHSKKKKKPEEPEVNFLNTWTQTNTFIRALHSVKGALRMMWKLLSCSANNPGKFGLPSTFFLFAYKLLGNCPYATLGV